MKILGLDLGANSVGWALIDNEKQEIIDMGVRVFSEGVENYGQGENEMSKNATRRLARQQRRLYDRRQQRKRLLQNWLKKNIFWPNEEVFNTTKKRNKLAYPEQFDALPFDAKFYVSDPYTLRAKALDNKLETWELARVLYHLVQRRGFFAHTRTKESGATYKGDEGKGILGIETTLAQFEGYRTYGEYLYKHPEAQNAKRKRYTLRAWYKEEFNLIWDKQAEFYPEILTEAHREYLEEKVIYFQRPLKDQKELIGKCKFEKDQFRTVKADPLYQTFVVHQQLNNLVISYRSEPKAKLEWLKIDDKKKIKLISELYTKDYLTIEDVKKKLLPLSFEFADEYGELKTIVAKEVDSLVTNYDYQRKLSGSVFLKFFKAQMKGLFQKAELEDYTYLRDQGIEVYDKVNSLSREDFTEWFTVKYYGATPEKATKIFDDLPDPIGTGSLSRVAIYKLMETMALGTKYHDACVAANYEHNLYTDQLTEEVFPSIRFKIDRKKGSLTYNALLINGTAVRNPVVSKTLYEMARVVNCVIKHYGNPDKIHLELARETTLSASERSDLQRKQKENESKNLFVRELIRKEANIPFATKSQILKYRLWEEQGKKCVYTGKSISVNQLFNKTMVDVDHIIPQGYTGGNDDSYMNKVVCFTEENRSKGMKMPFEWLSKQRFEQLKEILNGFGASYPAAKRDRLLATAINDLPQYKDFASKKLNDTRAATKHAVSLLRQVVLDKTHDGVLPLNGKTTANLRNNWFPGKNSDQGNKPFIENPILDAANLLPQELEGNKSRLDHRHHALDALVIALVKRSDVQQTAIDRNYKRSIPWEGVEAQAKAMLSRIIVSHRIENKPNSALHNETLYGQITVPPGQRMLVGHSQGSQVTALRKAIQSLTKKELAYGAIIDPVVEEIVHKEIRSVDPNWKPGQEPPKDWAKGKVLTHKNGLPIKKVRVAIDKTSLVQIRGNKQENGAWVDPQGNHHVCFYKDFETGKQRGEVIQYITTIERLKNKQPIISPNPKPDEETVGVLMGNDLVFHSKEKKLDSRILLSKNLYREIWASVYRIQKISKAGNQITLRHHSLAKLEYSTANNPKDKAVGRFEPVFGTVSFTKLKIDPAGFLTLA